jgi:subtilisin family serine protease
MPRRRGIFLAALLTTTSLVLSGLPATANVPEDGASPIDVLPTEDHRPDDRTLVVELDADALEGVSRAIATTGGTVVHHQASAGMAVLRVPAPAADTLAEQLRTLEGVAAVRAPTPVSIAGAASVRNPNDPLYGRQRETARQVGLPQAWARTTGAGSVVIAILDTGVDADHPDLAGRVLQGIDFVNGDLDPDDDHGHGTAAAGIAAAAGGNGIGIAGVCWKCQILPVKVLDASGSGDAGTVSAGIYYAVGAGADVISMSLAGPTGSGLDAAVQHALSSGVTVVAASGNDGSGDSATKPRDPAAIAGVIGVAAVDPTDLATSYTTRGQWVDVAAPGTLITTFPTGAYGSFTGTSAAAPVVAGAAALLRSLVPSATEPQVRAAIRAGVVQADIDVERGRVDIPAALSALTADRSRVTSMPRGGTPLLGDWDGDGVDTPGVHLGDTFYLRNSPTEGPADVVLTYGRRGDIPVVGDWDGDGVDTVGVVRDGNLWILRNEYRRGAKDIVMRYGERGDVPVTGDWNGDGRDTLGVVRGNLWILRNEYRRGAKDIVLQYGEPSDTKLVGDWDGDGVDTLGVRRGETFILRSVYRRGADDVVMSYGAASDLGIVGNWNGDRRDTLGVVRDTTWILRNEYRRGATDYVFRY